MNSSPSPNAACSPPSARAESPVSSPYAPRTRAARCYHFVKSTTDELVRRLDLAGYFPGYFDLAGNLMTKIGGYNGGLGGLLLHIERSPLRSLAYRIPAVGARLLIGQYRTKDNYEVEFRRVEVPADRPRRTYDAVFFASLNNYLNPFVRVIASAVSAGRTALLILPREAREWMNYPQVERLDGLDIVFIEDLLDDAFPERVRVARGEIAARCATHRQDIIRLFQYKGCSFGRAFYPVISDFLTEFVAAHAPVVNALDSLLGSVSHRGTSFYIARNKRALENAFVQVANHINGDTNMLVHGMLSLDNEKALFAHQHQTVARVHVWGQHDKDVIENRQAEFGERCPGIVVSPEIFHARRHTGDGRARARTRKVLFAVQTPTYRYIRLAAAATPADARLVVRLHPGQKHLLGRLRNLGPNVEIDGLDRPIARHYADSDLVVSYSSTTILEAISNDIPVLILDFEYLRRNSNSIFRENKLCDDDRGVVFITHPRGLAERIRQSLDDPAFRSRLLEANRRLMAYFVG